MNNIEYIFNQIENELKKLETLISKEREAICLEDKCKLEIQCKDEPTKKCIKYQKK